MPAQQLGTKLVGARPCFRQGRIRDTRRMRRVAGNPGRRPAHPRGEGWRVRRGRPPPAPVRDRRLPT
eukprot:2092797-Alexandrium_andersonii.AAC.1